MIKLYRAWVKDICRHVCRHVCRRVCRRAMYNYPILIIASASADASGDVSAAKYSEMSSILCLLGHIRAPWPSLWSPPKKIPILIPPPPPISLVVPLPKSVGEWLLKLLTHSPGVPHWPVGPLKSNHMNCTGNGKCTQEIELSYWLFIYMFRVPYEASLRRYSKSP